MKHIILVLGLIVVLTSFHGTKQDKQIVVSMSLQEWEVIYSALDNAPLAGEVRKPLLQKIAAQVQAQTQPPKVNLPVQKDSIAKPKKN